jgi:alkylated DNA repair dioxygenase AlkB
LDDHCWIDVGPRWLRGGDALYDLVATTLPWRRRTRMMFGERIDEPRLTAPAPLDEPSTPRVLADIAVRLGERYEQPLSQCWVNWYRDGDDAVAWHADRIGRTEIDPLVAIVSLGGPRTFRLRPIGGGASLSVLLHSGDLLVMGGSCQHRWQHCIPRQHGAGGRISLTFRRSG